jgi:hypothetical protein
MLHLFNKVYLSSDKLIDINFDRVVISNEYGVRSLESIDQYSTGILNIYGKNLNEAITNSSTKDFSGLIKKLIEDTNVSNKKLIIYVDNQSFINFLSYWLKFIFNNIDSSSAWKIVHSYIDKEKKYLSWRKLSTSDSNVVLFENITEELFKQIFNNTNVSFNETTYNSIKSGLSFEILLASYLFEKNSVGEHLKNTLKNILHRSMQELVLEIKHTVYKNIKKPLFANLIDDINFFKSSTLYKSEILGQVGSSSSVDIINATNEDIEKFKTVSKSIFENWEEFQTTSTIINRVDLVDYIRKDLTDADITYIIENEKTGKSNVRVFSSDDEEKINVYFLDFILNTISSELSAYKLN